MPKCPTGLTRGAQAAWRAWFEAWWAAFWVPGDLPGLPQVVRLYDAVERGRFQQHAELRLAMDTYGITPKGRQDRRWLPPEPTERPDPPVAEPSGGRRHRLQVV